MIPVTYSSRPVKAQTSERQVNNKIGKHINNRPAILCHGPQPRQNIIMGVSALLWHKYWYF